MRLASQMMNPEVCVANQSETIGDIQQRFLKLGIQACPLINTQNQAIGLVTLAAIVDKPSNDCINLHKFESALTVLEESTANEIGRVDGQYPFSSCCGGHC